MQLDRFPRFPLAHLPTPLEPLSRLSDHLGGPRIFVKRDDCTGLAFGGNKTRKLEYLVADALAQDATLLVSEGGLQSNHVRQTAAAAAKAGLNCELVLDQNVAWEDSAYRSSGNLMLDRLLGARVHLCPPGAPRSDTSPAIVEAARARGERPYFVPTGGSNAIGGLGFARCAREILDQSATLGLTVGAIVVASGSGGTQGGLIAGLIGMAEAGRPAVPAIGIDIDDALDEVTENVTRVANDCAGLLGLDQGVPAQAIDIRPGYAAPGYGLPNDGMIEAIELLARLEGLLLDPVYSGKAMAGLIDMVRRGTFERDQAVVFIHTGGAPALFVYPSLFATGP